MTEYLNKFAVPLFWAVVAYLKPIGNELSVLCLIFATNFFCGLITDIIVNNASFRFRKAWQCIKELVVFLALIVLVYQYGNLKSWQGGAMQIVSFVTYTVTYFYTINSLRNMKLLFKEKTAAHKVFSFLHFALSLEIVKWIPYLDEYLNKHEEK